jgi:hypothetical protein
MLSFDNVDAMNAALALPLDKELHALIGDRIADTIACELENLTHIIVVEPGDADVDFIDAIGFTPTADRTEGRPFGPATPPDWDWHHCYDGWWELIYTVGNDGFAYIVFVPDTIGVEPELLRLCRTYACPAKREGAVG